MIHIILYTYKVITNLSPRRWRRFAIDGFRGSLLRLLRIALSYSKPLHLINIDLFSGRVSDGLIDPGRGERDGPTHGTRPILPPHKPKLHATLANFVGNRSTTSRMTPRT